ncbi:GL25371 [Drosophila persimilis]|uniref:GL25371 n=1 Tax=Drosophila persimilis TaxID=7234 RepID=B4ISB6_DROPE|nr:GL25371 [Drosophila persimilis]
MGVNNYVLDYQAGGMVRIVCPTRRSYKKLLMCVNDDELLPVISSSETESERVSTAQPFNSNTTAVEKTLNNQGKFPQVEPSQSAMDFSTDDEPCGVPTRVRVPTAIIPNTAGPSRVTPTAQVAPQVSHAIESRPAKPPPIILPKVSNIAATLKEISQGNSREEILHEDNSCRWTLHHVH